MFDASHSVQHQWEIYLEDKRIYSPFGKSRTATGINALFIEVHDNPKKAMSDKNTVLDIKYLERILDEATTINKKLQELKIKYGENYITHET